MTFLSRLSILIRQERSNQYPPRSKHGCDVGDDTNACDGRHMFDSFMKLTRRQVGCTGDICRSPK